MTAGPLHGIKVLDLTHAMAGPLASQMLADLGATVIKIEIPPEGDFFRGIDNAAEGASSYYLALNRNKQSMKLNVKDPKGKRIILQLLEDTDVFLENLIPGAVDRLGVGYEDAKRVSEAIIYCHISGYGQSGPFRDRPAFDQIMQGEAGLLSMSGTDGSPSRVPIPITDILAGKDAAFAILAALRHRDKTGEGQELDVSLFASTVASYYQFLYRYWYKGETPRRWGTRHPFMVPYGVYETKDGFVNVAALGDRQWSGLCNAIGRPELRVHEDFARMEARVDHREELEVILKESLRKKTSDEWVQILTEKGVPCGNVNTLPEVISHPQMDHIELVRELPDVNRDRNFKLIDFPVKMSATPARTRIPPPELGEHTAGILLSLGYTLSEINDLRDLQVI